MNETKASEPVVAGGTVGTIHSGKQRRADPSRLFGPDSMKRRFVWPSCGHIAAVLAQVERSPAHA